MMRMARGQKFLALFVSGTLLPSLAPFNLWPIAIVSMAVLFRTLQHQTLKQAFTKSLVFGFGMFFAGVSWVYVSIHEHGFIPAPLALLATTLFCLFIAFICPALHPERTDSSKASLLAAGTARHLGDQRVVSQLGIYRLSWLYSGYIHTETWLGDGRHWVAYSG